MAQIAEAVAALEAERAAVDERKRQRHAKRGFYASRAWRALRYRALKANTERNGGVVRCEVCGRGKLEDVVIHVDHVVPISKDWTRRLDIANTQCMCQDCNEGKSNTDAIDWRPATARLQAAPCGQSDGIPDPVPRPFATWWMT